MSVTQDRIGVGNVQPDFILEFRTWNGAAYVWTDYTARLVEFKGVGAQVEERAYPNAFRMTLGDIIVDNSDGMFKDLDVLDGLLFNSAEPYGKSIYKRMVRVRDAAGGSVIATGLVRDVVLDYNTPVATIKVISLDARAADQKVDGDKAERHPLGGTAKTSPSSWTKTQPGSATGEVAMYRWREEESQGQVSYGWHKNRHYSQIVERTAWALDDLATDINKSYRINTSPAREIVSNRSVPPDDAAVSTGPTPDRTRAIVWNTQRSVLVCCVGNKVYDYAPTTDTYTLRNTLTAARKIVRAWYITVADSGGKDKRIVLLQYDVAGYTGRVTQAWVTVLDATGTGAYTLLANEVSLGTDVFPGTHFLREGATSGSDRIAGQWYDPGTSTVARGENIFNPFRQILDITLSGSWTNAIQHQDQELKVSIFAIGGAPANFTNDPYTGYRGYSAAKTTGSTAAFGYRYSYGQFPAATVNIQLSGGRLYFFVWDSGNLYRMAEFNLNNYTGPSYIALSRSSSDVPYYAYSHSGIDPALVWMCQMELIDTGTAYSLSRVYKYNVSTAVWTEQAWSGGATGADKAWTMMEFSRHIGTIHVTPAAIIFNRETRKWRFLKNITGNWSDLDTASQLMYGKKDQDNRLEGLMERDTGATPTTLFFVEAGNNMLWSWDNTTMRHENTSPNAPVAGKLGDPINTDRGLGALLAYTGANYPDTGTPNGILFGISANDYPYAGADQPTGEYCLWQFANFDAGFVPLLDFSGLSFWELRTLLAESFGFVHYYAPDGTLVFKPRTTSGALDFTFSEANRNLKRAQVDGRGFEAILNDVTVFPYNVLIDARKGEIIKGYNELTKDGELIDFDVSSAPGESSQWLIVFKDFYTFDLFKLQGANASATVAKSSSTLGTPLDGSSITDGAYLSLQSNHFVGAFIGNDTFIFWVLEPQEKLEKGGDPDRVRVIDQTSIDKYRRIQKEFDNRFIRKQISADYANGILAWRKERHDVVKISAAFDPDYLPLKRCTIQDSGLGLDGVTFQIMGVRHDSRNFNSELTLVRV